LLIKEALLTDFYFDLLPESLDLLNAKLVEVLFIFVQLVENEVDVLSNYFKVDMY
jgi:hypothetical protein